MRVHADTSKCEVKLDEAKTAENRRVVVIYGAHEQAAELSANCRAEVGKMVKIHEAENQITTLRQPSLPVFDLCNQRFFCRMAKKLGCQFCANDSR